jgi:hypothetical protein
MSKGSHCGQSRVAAAHRVVAHGFKVREEVEYQRRIKIAQGERNGWFAPLSFCVLEQQPERIAIRCDSSWTGILLLYQAVGKEALEQPGEFGGICE